MVQRITWQRKRAREVLAHALGFMSAQAMHATVRNENTGIGLCAPYAHGRAERERTA